MPGPVLTVVSPLLCCHGGQARAPVGNPRVTIQGVPALVQTVPLTIAGCANPPPPVSNGPCVSATWLAGSLRVTSMGVPLVLATSQAPCSPTPTPLTVVPVPARVEAF